MTIASEKPNERPRRILILDDEMQLADLFEMSLMDWFRGVEIQKFHNGNAAWDAITKRLPDLLILDQSHPGMGGDEILARLLEQKARCSVMLTSELFDNELRQRVHPEMNLAYLPKPFGVVQFWKMLNDMVGPSDYPDRQALVLG